jgi:ketoreductase RED2
MTDSTNPPTIDLSGKVAIVTGSSSGIGEAIARAFARCGAGVVVNSASSIEAGRALAAELPNAIYVQADVADRQQAGALVEAAVVNNAGTTKVIPHDDIDAVTTEVWSRILDVNVVGTWNVVQAAVPHLRSAADGVIINITSLAGVRPVGSSIPYAVSKAALNHMTRLLANTLGPQIRVMAVAPGLVATPWTADWGPIHERVSATAPLGRSGQPDDIADACLLMIAARYATGEVFVVDGGLGLR